MNNYSLDDFYLLTKHLKTKKMQKNLNKDLYSEQLFKVWSEKKGLLLIEDYLIKKLNLL